MHLLNPQYNEKELNELFLTHLDLSQDSFDDRFTEAYAEEIVTFDQVVKQAIEIADYLSCGIIKQFSDQFASG